MGMRRYVSLTLIGFCLSLLYPVPSKAVHKGAGDLTCGSCHTMHSSQGGTNGPSMGGAAGSLILLRAGGSSISSRAEIHKLCLQCHASYGSQATIAHAPQNVIAPKVSSDGAWTGNEDQSFRLIGAGGNFYTELGGGWDTVTPVTLGYGHSLGAPSSVKPPGGDQQIGGEGFSCTNCHDPHGTSSTADANTNIFRNLKVIATGAGLKSGVKFYNGSEESFKHKSYVGGVSGTNFDSGETDTAGEVIWPVYKGTLDGNPTNDSAKSNSYGTGDDTSLSPDGTVPATMSRWCSQCHDDWHEKIKTSNQVIPTTNHDWRRHPTDLMIPRKSGPGCTAACHPNLLDRQNYTTDLIIAGKGLPVTAAENLDTGAELVYYLPYQPTCTTGANSCMDNLNTNYNHRVFCLSCHFAHGGPYYDNLRWNYTSAVSSGSQTGNGIASNVGCQLCHNR